MGGCRDAAEAVDVDVDQAKQVARQTGERVAAGIDSAREKVEQAGSELRDAAQDASRAVSDAASPGTVDASTADALVREAPEAIACVAVNECTVSKAYFERLRANPGFVVGQARVVPRHRDGRAIGLEISGLESLPKLLGFRNGDVVRSINGLAVQSLHSAPQLYLQLRSARRFKVVFERGSVQQTCEIEVV